MDSVISSAYASATSALQNYLADYILPLWIWLLSVSVLLFVVGAVFSVFRNKRGPSLSMGYDMGSWSRAKAVRKGYYK